MRPQTLVSVMYGHHELVRDSQDDLRRIAMAARVMGQDRLADSLEDIAFEIVRSSQTVLDFHGKELSQDLNESQKAIGDTLRALVGA